MNAERPKYSLVKIKIWGAKLSYWYAPLVGEIIEVEKQTFKDSVAYKSLEGEAAYFFLDDIEEVEVIKDEIKTTEEMLKETL